MQHQDSPRAILVTGPAGFIGSTFVRVFRARYPDTHIVGIDNLSTGRREALDPHITFYEGSITDTKLTEKVFSTHEPEYVFHFAALPQVAYSVEHPTETTEVNLYGTVNLLEQSHRHHVKRFVFSSSAAIYGNATETPVSELTPARPLSPYGLQKYQSEDYCRLFSALYGLDTAVLRYFNVFGPGQYGGSAYATVVSAWLENLYLPRGSPGFLEGDGTQTRDFCYIDNVVDANIHAAFAPSALCGMPINVASGIRTSLNEIRETIERLSGKKLDLELRPARLGDIKDSHADIARLREHIGYEPTTDLETGLTQTIAWFEGRARYEKG